MGKYPKSPKVHKYIAEIFEDAGIKKRSERRKLKESRDPLHKQIEYRQSYWVSPRPKQSQTVYESNPIYSISDINKNIHTQSPLWYTNEPRICKIIEETIIPAIPGHFRISVKEFVEDCNEQYKVIGNDPYKPYLIPSSYFLKRLKINT